MEKEEQNLEQEQDERVKLVRKSRNENGSKATAMAAAVGFDEHGGASEGNGDTVHSESVENAADDEDKAPAEVQEKEKTGAINGEQKPRHVVYDDGFEDVGEQILVENGAEDEERSSAEEQKTEKAGGVLENESEAINWEQKSHNLVFFDDAEGIWKCRLCSWKYHNGSFCVDHIRNHKGYLHKLMNLETLNFDSKGVESESPYNGEKQILKDPGHKEFDISSLDLIFQNGSTSVINNGYGKEIEKKKSISSSNLKPPHVSYQEGSLSQESSKEIESADVVLINEDDLEIAESDVEKVIQNQTTHDLYCPNCNSCITKRVVLRKRKRRILRDEEAKRNRMEMGVDSKLGVGSVQSPGHEVGDGDARIEEADEDDHEREPGPAIFRCLSCFSFFIPTGNGLKWITSFLASNKAKIAAVEPAQPGSNSQVGMQRVDPSIPSSNLNDQRGQPSLSQETHTPTPEGGDKILILPSQKPSINGKVEIGAGDKLDAKARGMVDATKEQSESYTKDQLRESKPSQKVHVDHATDLSTSPPTMIQVTNGKYADAAIPGSLEDGLKLLIPLDNESPALEALKEGEKQHHKIVQPAAAGEHTAITIEPQPPDSSQTVQDIHPSETTSLSQPLIQGSIADSERAEVRKEFQIEVVKSVVYGGLAELVTSLSVVSSAAGGGATTLSVLAMGAANLIGGFFIICHNLWDLKCDGVEQVSNQMVEQRDRYRELLGRRHNFILHAILAITSYLVFGLVPPMAYGFSFRKSDDRHLKLCVVGAGSLLCILILAIAKAHTQMPPKPYLKTVATYVILGFMVSGISYAAGELVERLLDELGVFQNLARPGTGPAGSRWASY